MFFDVYIYVAWFRYNYFLEIAKNEIIITLIATVTEKSTSAFF